MTSVPSSHDPVEAAASMGEKKAAERGVGWGWSGVGVWCGVVKSLVFPFLVQSRPAAVVLCIFQTQLNEPGWGVGGGGGGSEAARAGAPNTSCFTRRLGLHSGNVAGRLS